MRHFILVSILTGGLARIPVTAATVRTLAFDLPATTVTFDIRVADSPPGSAAKLQFEAGKSQFTAPVNLPPGRYVASSKDFNATPSSPCPTPLAAVFCS